MKRKTDFYTSATENEVASPYSNSGITGQFKHKYGPPKFNPWHHHKEGITSLDSQQGYSPLKPRFEVQCPGLHGTGAAITASLTIPLGHWPAPHHINAFTHMGLCR
jgi:hypothetical protein